MSAKNFERLFDKARRRDSYWTAFAVHDFTEDLHRLMVNKSITKAELARRIGTSNAYITKVMRGNANFTIDSMVRLTRALGANLHIQTVDQEHEARFFEIIKGGASAKVKIVNRGGVHRGDEDEFSEISKGETSEHESGIPAAA